ncbi:MAG: carbohydrate binding domain-containing protein [Candidatus Brocadiaceae bacterium]
MSARQLVMKILGGIVFLFSLVVEVYGVNLAHNSSFECGLDAGYGYDGIVVKDDTTASHGISSLRIDTPDSFEITSDDIQLKPNTQYRFSLWAKASEGSDRAVVMRLVSSQTTPWFKNILIFTPTTDWMQYSTDPFIVPVENQYFRIWFENKGGTTGTSVWLDAIEVEETTGDIDYSPPPFEVGIEKISKKYYTYLGVTYPVNFQVRNNTSSSKTLQINYRVLDEYFNKEVKAGALDITAEANSTTAMMLANLSPNRRGKYIVYSDLLDGGTIISSSTFEFAVIEKVMKGESQFTDGFTVSGHSGGRGINAGTDDEAYDFRAEAGERWIRDRDAIVLKWSSIEPTEGEFVWTDFDNFLNAATKRGIRILPNLGSGCNYAQPDVPPNLPTWLANDARSKIVYNGTKKVYLFPILEWRNFVKACVTRYKGRITHWEILNEPGSYLTPAQYVSYLQAAFEEIKAADPAAKVIGICETQQGATTTQFLKDCYNNVPSAVNYCDIISFHGYKARLDGTVFSPPHISAEKGISDMKAAMNIYGAGSKELWMSELYHIGQPIVINGVNVDYPFQWDIKGHEPARRFLIDLANGVSKSFCVQAYYYTKHWAPKSWNDRPVGLVPSRWFVIYNTLAKLFESSTFVKQVLNTGFVTENLKLYVYDKSGIPIAATWHYGDSGTFTSLEFPGASGKIKVFDIMGNPASVGEVKQIGEKIILPQVSNTPYYIVPDNGTTSDEFINLMSAAGIADDKDPPVCSIRINNDNQYTKVPGVTLNLSATDNFGVAGYYISPNPAVPSATDTGWTSVTKTANYTANIFYTLSSGNGIKILYVWCKDAAGNVSNTASDTIEVDSIVPVVSITSPTSDATYKTTASTISLGGGVTDDGSGVYSVTWSSDKGESGTANGTTSWTISNISLTDGDTAITVTAADNAGNTGTGTIIISYGKAPTATTVSASNETSDSATLSGTVNAGGLFTTAWFDYGTKSGLYDNTTPVQNVSGTTDTPFNADISRVVTR